MRLYDKSAETESSRGQGASETNASPIAMPRPWCLEASLAHKKRLVIYMAYLL